MPSFSLRNPHTIIVGALIIVILGFTAFARMPVDVFPQLKIPAVVVATFYPGMPPLEMERDITTRFERFFTLGSDIEHIESRSLPGVSIIKVFFQPGHQPRRGGGRAGQPGDGRPAPPAARHAAAAGAAVGRLVAAGGAGDGLGQGLRRGSAPRPGAIQHPQLSSRRSPAPRCRRRLAASTARSWSTSIATRCRRAG